MQNIQKRVDDLGASAYLLMHAYKVTGKQGHSIIFEVTPEDNEGFEQAIMDYLSSEFHRFDSCLMSLKKMRDSRS